MADIDTYFSGYKSSSSAPDYSSLFDVVSVPTYNIQKNPVATEAPVVAETEQDDDKPSSKATFDGWTSHGDYDLPSTTTVAQGATSISSAAAKAIQFAESKIGSRYVYNTAGENGTYDCSGLVYAAYKAQGKAVPRSTEGWISSNRPEIDPSEAKPGDVIITGSSGSPSGRHMRLITRKEIITDKKTNKKKVVFDCVAAENRNDGVKRVTYTSTGNERIYRAKRGMKLIKKHGYK